MAADPGSTWIEIGFYFDEEAISSIVRGGNYTDGGSVAADVTITNSGGTARVISESEYESSNFTVNLNDGYKITAITIGGTEIEVTDSLTYTIDPDIAGDVVITTAKTDDTESGGGYFNE